LYDDESVTLLPEQITFGPLNEITGATGNGLTTILVGPADPVQPLTSVTVREYVPVALTVILDVF
jgi:hypothetical protein